MTKIVSYNFLVIITALKHQENPCEKSTAVKENPCEVRFRG